MKRLKKEDVCGSLIGLDFEKGGKAEILINAAELAELLNFLVVNTVKRKDVLAAAQLLNEKLSGTFSNVVFKAQMGVHAVDIVNRVKE